MGLLALAGICGTLLREPITALGQTFIDIGGTAGLFAGVMLANISLLPATDEPVIFLAISSGRMGAWSIFLVSAAASTLAGPVGYGLGALVGRATSLEAWVTRTNANLADWLRRRGAWAVAVCAVLPFPFAVSTWTAGMMRVGLVPVCAASLLRIPKTGFYFWLMVQGWGMGG